jgi:hypothetical protein
MLRWLSDGPVHTHELLAEGCKVTYCASVHLPAFRYTYNKEEPVLHFLPLAPKLSRVLLLQLGSYWLGWLTRPPIHYLKCLDQASLQPIG